jgi:hypothetical protein
VLGVTSEFGVLEEQEVDGMRKEADPLLSDVRVKHLIA